MICIFCFECVNKILTRRSKKFLGTKKNNKNHFVYFVQDYFSFNPKQGLISHSAGYNTVNFSTETSLYVIRIEENSEKLFDLNYKINYLDVFSLMGDRLVVEQYIWVFLWPRNWIWWVGPFEYSLRRLLQELQANEFLIVKISFTDFVGRLIFLYYSMLLLLMEAQWKFHVNFLFYN